MLAAILFFPVQVNAYSAHSAVLLDADTGRTLYSHNANERSLIASTTKIMTALIVCEQTNVLDRVRIPKEAVGIEGSSVYLREGEILTVQELLYGLMLHSGNDAAVALAIYCGGTLEGFVGLMNDKAHSLKLTGTHFENPHGLDGQEHYATAQDLAVLAAYAMDNPVFYKTVSAKRVKIGDRHLRNHNKLLWLLEGADGVKTGFTKAAGRILVSSVTRDGRRLIAVTINDPNDWQDHIELHTAGFREFSTEQLIFPGQCLGKAEVAGGDLGIVSLMAAEGFRYPIRNGEQVSVLLQKPGFVYAPVVEGADAGFAYVCIDGCAVAKIPLVYGSTVEQPAPKKTGFFTKLFGE